MHLRVWCPGLPAAVRLTVIVPTVPNGSRGRTARTADGGVSKWLFDLYFESSGFHGPTKMGRQLQWMESGVVAAAAG
jgi:hypothetical protein